MRLRFIHFLGCSALVPIVGFAGRVSAGIVADQVISYTPGATFNTYWGDPYTNSAAALGLPETTQNVPNIFSGPNQIAFADNSMVTPFNASYNSSHVVAMANSGGALEVHLSSPIVIGSGAALGVHSAAGLNELSFLNPVGQNKSPAENYTDPRSADLQISKDGVSWIDLGDQSFNNPTNTFTDNSPYGDAAASQPVNFFKPFFGSVSSFNGENWTATLQTLDGSAGGTWFDLSTAPLPAVNYVKFTTANGEELFVDSVVGVSVPEPTLLAPVVLGLLALVGTRRARMMRAGH